ncbi:MAG TPA: acyltransferase [Actinobacteria bacterium]|nr:acyltransferase [Actinomycetota bacterium]
MDVRRLVEATPADRNRTIDLVRVVSIVLVVLGHWLAAAVWYEDGALRFTNLLVLAPWAQWATWIVQVIPLFFVAGGFANRRSFASAHRRGEEAARWIVVRFRRLLTPVVPFLATWLGLLLVVRAAGVPPALVHSGSLASVTPLWFLAVYLLVIAAVPVTVALWERFGWRTVLVGALAAVAVDGLRFASDADWVGWANYVFVWGTAHQLGYAWASETSPPRRGILAAGFVAAFGVLVAVTVAGPYPISMVGIPGAAANNTLPPTAALLALTAVQYLLVRLVEPSLVGILRRRGPWTVVVAVQSVIMTLYLWHLPALALVVLVGHLAGVGFDARPLSATWWWTRPVWLTILAGVTAVLVWIYGRWEHRVRPVDRLPSPWSLAVGVTATIVGIAYLVVRGIVDAGGDVRWELVALATVGVVFLGAYPALRPRTRT